MRQRRLGRTGLRASEFALGGGVVGGILVHPADKVRLEALARAVRAGCDWVDTAADYGESEGALGRLLPLVSPRPRVSTKVRVDPAALGDLEGQVRRSLEASLARLRADRVELLQLHNSSASRPLAACSAGGRSFSYITNAALGPARRGRSPCCGASARSSRKMV